MYEIERMWYMDRRCKTVWLSQGLSGERRGGVRNRKRVYGSK